MEVARRICTCSPPAKKPRRLPEGCGFGRPHDKHASQVKSETYALSFVNPLDNPLIYTT